MENLNVNDKQLIIRHNNLIIRDHMVYGAATLPGVTYLDIIYRALQEQKSCYEIQVENLLFLEPLVTTDHFDKLLRLNFISHDLGLDVSIESRPLKNNVAFNEWQKTAEAKVSVFKASKSNALNITTLKAAAVKQYNMEELYQKVQEVLHIQHGPFMKADGNIYVGENYVLAKLWLSNLAAPYLPQYCFHPAILDSSTLLFFIPILLVNSIKIEPVIPFMLRSFRAIKSLPSPCYAYFEFDPETYRTNDIRGHSLVFYEESGEPIVWMEGLSAKEIRQPDHITRLTQLRQIDTEDINSVNNMQPTRAGLSENSSITQASLADSEQDSIMHYLCQLIGSKSGEKAFDIDPHKNFFELGLDSIHLIDVVRQLESYLSTQLYPTLLFEYDTIDKLAVYLTEHFGGKFSRPIAAASSTPDLTQPMSEFTGSLHLYQEKWISEPTIGDCQYKPGQIWLIFLSEKALVEIWKQSLKNMPIDPIYIVCDSQPTIGDLDKKGVKPTTMTDFTTLVKQLIEQNKQPDLLIAAYANNNLSELENEQHYLQQLFSLLQACSKEKLTKIKILLSYYSQFQHNLSVLLSTGGFFNSLILEHPHITATLLQWLDVGSNGNNLAQWCQGTLAEINQPMKNNFVEVLVHNHKRSIKVLTRLRSTVEKNFATPGDVYLITGGLGGLGLKIAEYLLQQENLTIILVGRTQLSAKKNIQLQNLNRSAQKVFYRQCDVTQLITVQQLVADVCREFGHLSVIIHSAGIIDDALFLTKTWEGFSKVLAVKMNGAKYLDEATAHLPLKKFILCSSVTALIGNVGQSDYALANRFLDNFAYWRNEQVLQRKRQGHTISIRWPWWAEGGMQIDEAARYRYMQETGAMPLPTAVGLQGFKEGFINNLCSEFMVLYGDPKKIQTYLSERLPCKFTDDNAVILMDEFSLKNSEPQSTCVKSLPLTTNQEQLYAIHLLDPTSVNYNIGFAIQLKGHFNSACFHQALNRVIKSHENFRSAIVLQDDKPSVIIYNEINIEVPIININEIPSKEQKARVTAITEDLRSSLLDLAIAPLLKMCLIQLNDEEYVFVAIFHHIIMDGWSIHLFIKELGQHYNLLINKKIATFELPAYDHSNYVNWQQSYINSHLPSMLNYWLNQLSSLPDNLQLPTDFPQNNLVVQLKKFSISFPSQLTKQLKKVSQELGVSLFAYLLTAYQLWLSRYTSQQEIIIGVPLWGRDNLETQNVMGFLVNTVPLLIRLEENFSYVEVARKNQKTLAEAIKHQYVPLATLIRELKIPRYLDIQPLFDVLFNFINFPPLKPDFGILQSDLRWTESGSPAYTLNLEIQTTYEGFNLTLKYNANLFTSTTIERMVKHFMQLLSQSLEAPKKPLHAFSLLNSLEKQQLLIDWNHTHVKYPPVKTLHELLEKQAERTPEDIALIFGSQQLTYRELNCRANQLANYINQQGVGSETIVAISLERCCEFIISILAILKVGGAYLALDHSNPKERLMFMLQDSQASILITKTALQNNFSEYRGKQLFLDQCQEVLNNLPSANLNRQLQDNQLAYIIYTSGSTGLPKGVLIEHQSVINCVFAIQNEVNINADAIFLAVTALSFDVSVLDYFLPFAIGAKTIIASQLDVQDPNQLFNLLNKKQVNTMQATPALWRMLVNSGWQAKVGLKILTAGEALSRTLAEDLLRKNCEIYNIYGPTEASIYTTIAPITSAEMITIGKPLANLQVYILDNRQQPVPIGVPGELYIGGAGVARGYLNRADLTAERFITNPFATIKDKKLNRNLRLYKTGDLVCYLANGTIKYLGRIDQQVKLRGYRIELEEIENALIKLPEISQAVVSLYEDDNHHKQLIAFIVLHNLTTREISTQLQMQLGQWLPNYMIPAQFFILERLPVSPSGKVDKKALIEVARTKIVSHVHTPELGSSMNALAQCIQADILQLIAEILCLDSAQIDCFKPFGEYGFDSIRFGEFSIKLGKHFNIEITPTLFYRYTSVNNLSTHLAQTYGYLMQKIFAEQLTLSVQETLMDKTQHSAITNPQADRYLTKTTDDIAIIGMAGKLPQSASIDIFWQNLVNNKHFVTEIPAERWDWQLQAEQVGTKWGSFIKDVDKFEADFFNISRLEAELMDPQQRLLMESIWNTIEDAGYSATDLAGTNTGVFIGSTGTEYGLMQQAAGIAIDMHSIAGNVQSIVANRISYFFNFKGPSAIIDTACSSSLIAVHRAVAAINAGECETAVVGGVNLLLSPDKAYLGLSKMGMLSDTGACKAFDEAADGYVRGEGVVTLLLKPLAQSLNDKDHIYAIIKGTAENHGGKTHGLTVPNPQAQSEVIVRAHQKAGIDPRTISYIEAHGTGTRLGDPIEVEGLQDAFNILYRAWNIENVQKTHCGIGSVKTNIGHLEGAAGIAGLLKVILALQHKMLPGNLHLKTPNAALRLENTPFYLAQETQPWQQQFDINDHPIPRRAGISSFGFGGSNAHVVVEEVSLQNLIAKRDKPYYLLTLSAKCPQSLQQRRKDLAEWLKSNTEIPLAAIAYTLNKGRQHFTHRCAFVIASVKELLTTLEQLDKSPRNYLYSKEEIKREYEPAFDELMTRIEEDIINYQQLDPATYQKKLLVLADLYIKGYDLNWDSVHQDEAKQRISLPTYPFLQQRYWIPEPVTLTVKPTIAPVSNGEKPLDKTAPTLGYYCPVWSEALSVAAPNILTIKSICVFSDHKELISTLQNKFKDIPIVQVQAGNHYQKHDDYNYTVCIEKIADYQQLLVSLQQTGITLSHFLLARTFNDAKNRLCFATRDDLMLDLQEHYHLLQAIIHEKIFESHYFASIYPYNNLRLMHENMLNGFAKSIVQDFPQFTMQIIGLEINLTTAELCELVALELNMITKQHTHTRYINHKRYIQNYQLIQENNLVSTDKASLRQGGVYLITGGLGGVGFIFARYLAQRYQAKLILIGRSSLDADKEVKLRQLNALGAKAYYLIGDVGKEESVQQLIAETKRYFGKLHGIIHCAGIQIDPLLFAKSWETFEQVLAAKVWGTIYLERATQQENLDIFILFSSIVSFLGYHGQSDYGSANAFLDAFAGWQHAKTNGVLGTKTIAINWPLWADGNMQLHEFVVTQMTEIGLQPLDSEKGIYAFEQIIRSDKPNIALFYGDQDRLAKVLNEQLSDHGRLPNMVNTKIVSKQNIKDLLLQEITMLAALLIKAEPEKIASDVRLSEYGFDSIIFTVFSTQLNQQYHIDTTPALFFSHATLGELTNHLLRIYQETFQSYFTKNLLQQPIAGQKLAASTETSINQLNQQEYTVSTTNIDKSAIHLEDIAVIGMSCLTPGADDQNSFWQNLMENNVFNTAIPETRKKEWFDKKGHLKDESTKNYYWGAFLADIDKFDADFFKIVPREAQLLDPQQRLLLQEVWHCIENAAYKPCELAGKNIAVYVGAQGNEYSALMQDILDPKIVTGNAQTMLANRISYQFDFTGASETIDASCASSLVAVHKAVRALQLNDCEMAIAAGINLVLSPRTLVGAAQLGILSQQGQCCSFAQGGDGFVKGEGIGVLLLKKHSQAVADGDYIHGVIKGCAVNHNGHSHTISSPNGERQADVMIAALKQAQIDFSTINYIEAQATGSEMGDAVEFEAYKTVWQRSKQDHIGKPCYLGSVKPNIGHLEAASGIISVIKMLLALQKKIIPSVYFFKKLNPYIHLANTPFQFTYQSIEWPDNYDDKGNRLPRRGAVHNYAFGGVNAHLILEEYSSLANNKHLNTNGPYVLVLSAKSTKQLQQYARNMSEYLANNVTLDLVNMAFTLQMAREDFSKRIACIFNDRDELIKQLNDYYNGSDDIVNVYYGDTNTKTTNNTPVSTLDQAEMHLLNNDRTINSDLKKLAISWADGAHIDWRLLYTEPLPRRIPLPTYPFAKNRYWFSDISDCSVTVLDNDKATAENVVVIAKDTHWQNYLSNLVAEMVGMRPEQFNWELSLFEQGIDSIYLAQLITKIERECNVHLNESVSVILALPSINNISSQILLNSSKEKIDTINKIDHERVVALQNKQKLWAE